MKGGDMSRKTTYYCDVTGEEFGNSPHINLKSINLNIAFQQTVGNWKTRKINLCNGELHFRDVSTFLDWLEPKIEEVFLAVQSQERDRRERTNVQTEDTSTR